MIGKPWRGRRMGVLLIAGVLLALALAPTALGADRIYWGNGGNDTISYANLDGSGGGGELNIAGTTTSKPHGLAIDPGVGKIYWANDNNTISYANLDGSGGGQLNISGATPDAPYGAAIDPAAGRIYWANRGTNTISYANLDGSGGGGELNISGASPNDPHGVVIDRDRGRIYWANFGNTISYANLDGSGGGGQLNLSGATGSGGVGMAIDPPAGRIYWGNLGDDSISYANLDGSGGGGQLNISGAMSYDPRFLALLRTPRGVGAPQITGGSRVGSVLSCSQGGWAPDLLGSFFYRAPRSLAYQWTRGDSKIAGAAAGIFKPKRGGSYACRVTATNEAGSASQTSASLKVRDPKCKKLRKKRKRQKKNLAKAATEAQRSTIQANIKDTRKRLKKHGC
jgi:hypothetical protein